MTDNPDDLVIVGVDNGIKGGLCAVSGFHGHVIRHTPMPIRTVGDKEEVDVVEFIKWFRDFHYTKTLVVAEEPLKHAKSSQAIRSMALNFGKIIGACESRGIPSMRVQVKEWQDIILGKNLAKGQTKVIALQRAQSLWPNESWIPPRCRTPHDGIIDAALIAHFHRSRLKLP